MNTRTSTYKLLGLIVCLGGVIGAARLQAQSSFTLPFSLTQSSPATAFSINTAGTLTESGPLNSSATLTLSGSPQMVWFPAFGAFRAGAFSGSQTSIGQYSFATGASSIASGQYSVATGSSTASGQYSLAIGCNSTASGGYSVALGDYAFASNAGAVSMGGATTASGFYSLATGSSSTASAFFSMSAGNYTHANSYSAIAAGQYNVGLSSTGATPNANSWVATDPLFELGNGTLGNNGFNVTYSDALVVYKNGSATFQGVVTVAAGGDIPMYTGN